MDTDTFRAHVQESRLRDDAAAAYLARATWVLVATLATMALSIGALQVARVARAGWVLHGREVSQVALGAQLAATERESAARAYLASPDPKTREIYARTHASLTAGLDSLRALTVDNPTQYLRAVKLAQAVAVWDSAFVIPAFTDTHPGRPMPEATLLRGLALFDALHTNFSNFLSAENALYRDRVAAQTRSQGLVGLALLVSLIVLVVLLTLMRRRLGQEIARTTARRVLIEEQNEELRNQRDAIELHAEQLQDQAMELETQAAELQEHTADLEAANRHLNDSERRLAEAQQIAQIGTWEVDPQTREIFWSDEMFRLLDVASNDFIPSFDGFMAHVHEDDRALVRAKMGMAMRGEGAFEEEIRVRRPDGSLRRLLARGNLVTWDGADRRKVVGTAQDITERKRTELELHDTEARLRQSQKMEAIGQLAGGVAHDFNNLLTVILSYAAMLLTTEGDIRESYGPLEDVKDAAERAAALTRQLLAFSRQQVLQPRVLDLNETVKNVHTMLRRLIAENIEVRTVCPPNLGFVTADPGQIEQVLLNLAVNARDAMPNGGALTIETANVDLDGGYVSRGAAAKAGPHVMLAVSDNGTGIAADVQERIFDPFFTTKPKGSGTGLGLSTVHGIVEQSGGHVLVYSEIGLGTTFKIYFPRTTSDHADVRKPAPGPDVRRGSEAILLVEDDRSVRSVTCRMLKKGGYSVIEAADGAAAIEICDDPTRHIDMILTDLVMPGITGGDLVNALRIRRPGIRVLLMSGYTRDSVVRVDVIHASSSFIEKPFTPDSLLRTVRDLLDRQPEQSVAHA